MTAWHWISASVVAAVLLLGGCRTMDSGYRGMTKMTNPDKVTLRGGVKWASAHPRMRQVSPDRMVAYLRIKNTSGSELDMVYLDARVRANLQAAGYRVTSNVDEAQYTVHADLRFYGENSNKDGGAGILTGAVLGGVGGAVAGHAIRSTSTSTGLGAAGGALIGAGIANVMANRNKMVEIDLVLDVSVGERIRGGVQTVQTTEQSSKVAQSTSTAIAGGGVEGGSSSGSSTAKQRVTVQDSFLYHDNRLVAHAVKMGLTPDEALPFLADKVATSLGSVLP